MASASVPVKYLDDITECSICTQVFTDPRVLPCIHTFCLKCIEEWGKKSGDELECPLCRKKLDIREGKYEDLPKNFFVEKLLEVKRLSGDFSQKETMCDICTSDDEEKTVTLDKPSATVYCIDCQKNMCSQCHRYHQKFKNNSLHKLVDVGTHFQAEDLLLKYSQNQCNKHPDENVKIYCFDCKLPLCMMCCVTSHNSHKCSDVKEVATEMSAEIKSDVEAVNGKVKECKETLDKVAERRKELTEVIAEVEKQIVERAEELKRWIENYKLKLLEELTAEKKKQEKQLETLKCEVEDRLLMIESFKKYSDELRTKGTACDIVRAASGLRDRAKELKEVSVGHDLNVDSSTHIDIRFISQSSADKIQHTFGELQVMDMMKTFEESLTNSTKPAHIIPGNGKYVTGVTSVGDELFVVRYLTTQVDVYDVVTLSAKRQITVPQTNLHYDVVGCDTNKCIYVADIGTTKIYRVEVTDNNTVTNWSVCGPPCGLSMTSDHNVLVAMNGISKMQEYTTQGTLVREITLQSGITNPLNVVQLSSGQFGVTHGDSLHRYCVVGLDGQVMKSYGSSPGSGDGQLNWPYGLSVSKRGTVFIADYGNSRVLMLDPATFTASQLSVDGGFSGNPFCVYVDESRGGRLYIGEMYGQNRVIVLGK